MGLTYNSTMPTDHRTFVICRYGFVFASIEANDGWRVSALLSYFKYDRLQSSKTRGVTWAAASAKGDIAVDSIQSNLAVRNEL